MSALRWLVAGVALVLACSDGGEGGNRADRANSAASNAALAPGEFRLEPGRGPERIVRQDSKRGVIEQLGLSLREHIANAWDVSPRDLEVAVELPEGSYDVRVRAQDGALETAEALVRGGLAEHFGLRVRAEERRGEVFVLSLAGSGLVPEPVDPTELASVAAEPIEPIEPVEPIRARGHYRGAGASIEQLARYLRNYGRRPIVDETRLTGHYDIVLEWDPDAGSRALHAALRDAGFVLRPAQRRFVVHVVEPSP